MVSESDELDDHQQNATMFQYCVHFLYLQSVFCPCIIVAFVGNKTYYYNESVIGKERMVSQIYIEHFTLYSIVFITYKQIVSLIYQLICCLAYEGVDEVNHNKSK